MISSTLSLLKLQNFVFLHQNPYAYRLMCQWVGRRVGRWIGRWIGGSVSRSASWSQGLKTAGRPLRFGSSATRSSVSCFHLSLSLSLFSRSVSLSLSLLVFARGWNSLLGRLGSSTEVLMPACQGGTLVCNCHLRMTEWQVYATAAIQCITPAEQVEGNKRMQALLGQPPPKSVLCFAAGPLGKVQTVL